MFFEFAQSLLRNFNPNSMEVIYPDVLTDIRGEYIDDIEIVNSVYNLPKMPIIILGNRMIGPSVTQQKTKKQAYAQDTVKNFLTNSSMSNN